jgi:hypothetical protein
MTRRIFPVRQGAIDGLCSIYAVLNACRLLGVAGAERVSADAHWDQSKRLFRALCLSHETRALFPEILCEVARHWTPRHSAVSLSVRELKPKGARPHEFFERLREEMRGAPGERHAFILGLAAPWDHWTVVRRVRKYDVVLFDSNVFPSRRKSTAPFRSFTFDRHAPGVATRKRHVIDTQRGFLLTSTPK